MTFSDLPLDLIVFHFFFSGVPPCRLCVHGDRRRYRHVLEDRSRWLIHDRIEAITGSTDRTHDTGHRR